MEPNPRARRAQLQHFYRGLPISIRNKIEKPIVKDCPQALNGKVHELWKKDTLELYLIRAAQCRDIVKEEFGDYTVGFRREATKAILLKMQETDRLAAEAAFESIKALLDAGSSEEEEDEQEVGDDEKEEGELDEEEDKKTAEAVEQAGTGKVDGGKEELGKDSVVALGEVEGEKELVAELGAKEEEKNVDKVLFQLEGMEEKKEAGKEGMKSEEEEGTKGVVVEMVVEKDDGKGEEKEGTKEGGEMMVTLVEGHGEELGGEESDEEDGWNYGYEEMREYTDSDFEELEAYYRAKFMS